MFNSSWPHELQHTRLPCPWLSPRICSNSCSLSRWCHPIISSCHPFLLLPSIFPSIRVFSNESALCIRWSKYCSFSISPSNEYSELISFSIDWFDLLAAKGILKSSWAPQFKNINSLALSLLHGPTLASTHDYWKTIALTILTLVNKVMSPLFNMLSRFVIAFPPRSKRLLISWL